MTSEGEVTPCRRCLYLDIRPPGIARRDGLCNWCLAMGEEDNRLRAKKGMKVYDESHGDREPSRAKGG